MKKKEDLGKERMTGLNSHPTHDIDPAKRIMRGVMLQRLANI